MVPTNAVLAITEIFLPFFKPDVLVMDVTELEQFKSRMEILDAIFLDVAKRLSEFDCIVLSSARSVFSTSSTPDFSTWQLHQFAVDKNRDDKLEEQMVYEYKQLTQRPQDLAGYLSKFYNLKVSP